MKKKSSKVSLNDVANMAGVSKASASVALHNRPGVSEATRERIVQIAEQLGYAPDARMAAIMAGVQNAKVKQFLPIAWLDTHWDQGAWKKFKFMSPYLEGARKRAWQLGYRLEEIWIHEAGLTMRRLAQIIYQRGIEGAIVTQFARHLRLNWDHLAGISLEGGLLGPQLDRVMTDYSFNITLALKMVRRFGYRRVGICLEQDMDANSAHMCRAIAHYFQASTPGIEKIEPLFYPWGRGKPNQDTGEQMIISWIKRNKPDVIVGHSCLLVDFVETAGYRVPEEIGVVHLATDDDVSDWAGIHSNRREIGAAAVNHAISHIQNRQFGVPAIAKNLLIPGSWHDGRTLLIPKPK